MLYKIYTLSDSTGKDIFYVGCTKRSVSVRLMQHLRCSGQFSKEEKIRSLNYEVLIKVVEVIESEDKKEIKAAEEKWILFYKKNGYALTNKTKTKSKVDVENVGYTFSSKKLKSYNRLSSKLKKVG